MPVDEREIADALGYRIREIDHQDISGLPDMDETLDLSPAHLIKENRLILVKKDMPWTRKRLSIFHELGHAVIPWHSQVSYSCSEKDIDRKCIKEIEKQAFDCGAEFMMPSNIFIPYCNSLPLGIDAIKELANYFEASLESTAIRYVKLNRHICAIMIMEEKKYQKNNINYSRNKTEYQPTLYPENTFNIPHKEEIEESELMLLKVKYFVRSFRFPKYFGSNIEIGWGNPITKAWIEDEHIQTEIPASLFGSSSKMHYMAECFPLGKTWKIMVFLWIPDRQQIFTFGNEVLI